MSFEDIDDDHIKMCCDWCGKSVWWINGETQHDEVVLKHEIDKAIDGWVELDAHVLVDGCIEQPFPLKHLCPKCYLKRLG